MEYQSAKNEQRPEGHVYPGRDRLDWISKYLELADKVIAAHPPEKRRNQP